MVLQGSQALTQVLQIIDPTFKLLVQQEGITLPPLHSTKDEDWPTMYGVLSAYLYIPNHWALKFLYKETQSNERVKHVKNIRYQQLSHRRSLELYYDVNCY